MHLRGLGEDLFWHVKITLYSNDKINLTINVEDDLLATRLFNGKYGN